LAAGNHEKYQAEWPVLDRHLNRDTFWQEKRDNSILMARKRKGKNKYRSF